MFSTFTYGVLNITSLNSSSDFKQGSMGLFEIRLCYMILFTSMFNHSCLIKGTLCAL